tara:strand:+ start:185 stop:439 length:255 start_codon:yes stop_codon:yes gene_type:complete
MVDNSKPRIDPTINIGHLISLGGVLLLAIGGYYSFSNRLVNVETQLSRITSVLEASIRQDEQIKNLRDRVNKIESKTERAENAR